MPIKRASLTRLIRNILNSFLHEECGLPSPSFTANTCTPRHFSSTKHASTNLSGSSFSDALRFLRIVSPLKIVCVDLSTKLLESSFRRRHTKPASLSLFAFDGEGFRHELLHLATFLIVTYSHCSLSVLGSNLNNFVDRVRANLAAVCVIHSQTGFCIRHP